MFFEQASNISDEKSSSNCNLNIFAIFSAKTRSSLQDLNAGTIISTSWSHSSIGHISPGLSPIGYCYYITIWTQKKETDINQFLSKVHFEFNVSLIGFTSQPLSFYFLYKSATFFSSFSKLKLVSTNFMPFCLHSFSISLLILIRFVIL